MTQTKPRWLQRCATPNRTLLTLLVSGYPDVKSAMDAIFLEADEIIVKPFEAGKLAELIHQKMSAHKPAARTAKERVAAVLQRCSSTIVEEWLARVKKTQELISIPLTDKAEPNVPGGKPTRSVPQRPSPMARCANCKATLPACWCTIPESSRSLFSEPYREI